MFIHVLAIYVCPFQFYVGSMSLDLPKFLDLPLPHGSRRCWLLPATPVVLAALETKIVNMLFPMKSNSQEIHGISGIYLL